MSAAKFRKRPVVIDAIRWTGENWDDVSWFLIDGGASYVYTSGELSIETLEGGFHVTVGDWIIRGVQDEFYPCKPDIFEATYEPAGVSV